MTMRYAMMALAALVVASAAPGRPVAAADPVVVADPAANRKASTEYNAGLRNNPAFRDNREHLECDPIQSLDLRAQCIASFEQPALPPPKPAAETPPPDDPEHPTVTITNGPVHDPGDE
jgi:hypothetical protein